MLIAAKQSGHALRYVAPEFKADREFMLEAVKQNRHSLRYVAPEEKRRTARSCSKA